jgi:hypothetical protein
VQMSRSLNNFLSIVSIRPALPPHSFFPYNAPYFFSTSHFAASTMCSVAMPYCW